MLYIVYGFACVCRAFEIGSSTFSLSALAAFPGLRYRRYTRCSPLWAFSTLDYSARAGVCLVRSFHIRAHFSISKACAEHSEGDFSSFNHLLCTYASIKTSEIGERLDEPLNFLAFQLTGGMLNPLQTLETTQRRT